MKILLQKTSSINEPHIQPSCKRRESICDGEGEQYQNHKKKAMPLLVTTTESFNCLLQSY